LAAACGGDDDSEANSTDTDSTEAASSDSGDDSGDSSGESDSGSDDGGEGEAAAPEQVTLRFSWWGGDSRHEYTQQLIEMYMADNPNVTIEADFTGWGNYWEKLATTTAAGDTPDIMQHEIRFIREYADRGVLADLNPYLGSTIDTTDLDTETLGAGQVDGATYALPTGVNAFSVVVDPVAFSDAGIDIPDDSSWTWEDFEQIAADVSSASGGDVYGTQDPGGNEANLQIFLRQQGQDLYNADGSDLGFDAATMAEWWERGADLRGQGAPTASVSVEVGAGGIDQSLTATNRGAMGFWWSNQLGALTSNSGRDLQLLRFPGGVDGMYLKPAMFWAMSSSTEHPEEAAKFIDFMLNSQEAADIMLTDRGLPVNLAIREAITGSLDAPNQQAAAFVSEVGPEVSAPPVVPPQGAGDVAGILTRYNEQVLFDQLSIEDAVDGFMSEARAAIGAS
jgi:multiple sugar transport system substrate-binding protein